MCLITISDLSDTYSKGLPWCCSCLYVRNVSSSDKMEPDDAEVLSDVLSDGSYLCAAIPQNLKKKVSESPKNVGPYIFNRHKIKDTRVAPHPTAGECIHGS